MNKLIKHKAIEDRVETPTRSAIKISAVVGAFTIYALAYLPLRAQFGNVIGLLAIVPLGLAGQLFGLRGGFVAGLVILPLHTILMNLAGYPGWDVVFRETNGLGFLVTIAVGIATGYHSDLVRELRKEISERRQSAQALNESEARYRAVVENQTEFIVRWKPDGTRTFVNEAYLRCFGLTYEQATSSSFASLVSEQDRKAVEEKIARLASGSVASETDIHQSLLPNGELVWQEWTDTAIRDDTGNLIEFQSVGRDITERKAAEEKLRSLTNRLETLVNVSPLAIFILDTAGNVELWNPAAERIFGWKTDEVIGHPNPIIPTDRQDEYETLSKQVFQGSPLVNSETVRQRKDGSLVDISISSAPLYDFEGNITGRMAIIADITEHKQAIDELRESEERHRMILETAMDGFWVADLQGHLLEVNQSYCRMSGYSQSELLEMSIPDLEVVDSYTDTKSHLQKLTELGQDRFETKHRRKDGSIFDIEVSVQYQPGGNGRMVGFLRDIAERKRAEETLRDNEEKLRTVFNTMEEGMALNELIFDENGEAVDYRILEINPAYEKSANLTREQAVGRTATEIYPMTPEEINAFWRMHRYQEHAIKTDMYFPQDKTWRHISTSKIIDNRFATIFFDNTEQKNVELALRESEERLKFSQQVAHVGHWTWDTVTNRVIWSDEMKRIFGLDPETFDGDLAKVIAQAIHPEDREKVDASNNTVLTDQKPAPMEYRVIRPDGSVRTVWAEPGEKILDPNGNIIKLSGIVQDITERKQAEQALRESEALYRQAIEVAGAVPYYETYYDEGTSIKYEFVGDGIRQITGYGPEEFNAKLWDSLIEEIHPVGELEGLTLDDAIQVVRQGEIPIWKCEHRIRARDGETHWVFEAAVELRDENGISHGSIGTYQDITQRKQAEEKLRESEEKYRSLVETAQELVWKCDSQGRFIYLNPSWEKTHGYRVEEMLGKGFGEFQQLKVYERDVREFSRHMAGGSVKEYETTHIAKDGRELTLLFNAVPLMDTKGNVIGTQGTAIDITERRKAEKKLEQQNQRLKTLREIDTAILSADSVENIVDVALHRTHELIECRRVSISLIDWGTKEVSLFDIGIAGKTSSSKGMRVSLKQFESTIKDLSKNQLVIINDLTGSPNLLPSYQTLVAEGLRSLCMLPLLSQGNLIGAFTMLSDIPDFFEDDHVNLGREIANQVAIAITQSNLLGALKELNAELEQRVAQRTAQLQAANKELEAFSYSVSHDLRAPLRGIDGFSKALTRKYSDAFGEEGIHYLTRIQENTNRMGQLIDDLLSLSRVTRREMKQDHVDLSKLAHEITHELHAHEPERHVRFKIEEQVGAWGDAGLLRIVLHNLLANAFKFTSTREQAEVEFGIFPSAQSAEGAGGDLRVFFVHDNGVGFDMSYADKLFGAFQRLHAMDEFPGTGIGLATVQRIIHRHGGEIWAEAEINKGATFYFTLGGKL